MKNLSPWYTTHRILPPPSPFFALSIPVILKKLNTLQMQPLPFQQSLYHLPALLQEWTAKIIQNVIILDKKFPMRPHYKYPSHWHPLLTTKFRALSVTQFLMGAVSVLRNSNLHHAILHLPQGLSCGDPLSSFCLFCTTLSKIIRGIKSQWTVWKRASIEIILIDTNDTAKETQFKRSGRSYFVYLTSSVWYREVYFWIRRIN